MSDIEPQEAEPMNEDAGTEPHALAPPVAALKRDLEALLFAAGDPLSVDAMVQALAGLHAASTETVASALHALAADYPARGSRGMELVRLAGGWVFRTNALSQPAVAALYELPADVSRLSSAGMECLAIVAYLQPVSRSQIAEVRGVNSDSPLRTLLDRELITDVGRAQGGGGPILYATTPRFEAMFGLADLNELPSLEGFALTEEQKDDLRRRLGLLGVPE